MKTQSLAIPKVSMTMLVLVCSLFAFAGPAKAVTLWSDGFESGDFTTGGWSTLNNNALVGTNPYTGTYGAETKRASWYEKAFSTVGYSDIHVRYVRKTIALDAGEFLYAEWYDGAAWSQIEATQDTAWVQQDWTLPAGANGNANFKIRFRSNPNGANERTYVDDVEITGIPATFTISGNAGLVGVTITGLPGSPVTDALGDYTVTVDYDWSGTATPTKAGFTFSPVNIVYSNVQGDQLLQD